MSFFSLFLSESARCCMRGIIKLLYMKLIDDEENYALR